MGKGKGTGGGGAGVSGEGEGLGEIGNYRLVVVANVGDEEV